MKFVNLIHHIYKLNQKKKNHRISSLDTEKAFDKTQYPFIIKVFNIFGIQGIYLNIIKALYSKQIVYFKLN